jgi:hypothetical protein
MIMQLGITDLTRMQKSCVCIAGYDKDKNCVRLILPPPGIKEASLVANGKPIIFPFAVIEIDLAGPRPQPPHSEDCNFNPASVKFIRVVKEENRERFLRFGFFDFVEAIFEQTIHDDFGFYVMDGCGPRSVGTILPKEIVKVKYEQDITGNWDYRLQFIDSQDRTYRLKITDLTWQYYCNSLRDSSHSPAQVATDLSMMLQSYKVFLRIGLARGWAKYPDRCYLQVNGIHTIPDYLKGKTFADFRTGR